MGDEDEDQQSLLAILQAQGEQFMASFGSSPTPSRKRKRRSATATAQPASAPRPSRPVEMLSSGSSASGSNHGDRPHSKKRAVSPDGRQPQVVVFSGPSKLADDFRTTKATKREFMSAKVTKVVQGSGTGAGSPTYKPTKGNEKDPEEEEDNRSNLANDFELHKLVHTQLVNSSERQDLTRGKHKSMLGRVLEVGGSAKIGEGEATLRGGDIARATNKVKAGLRKKLEQRRAKEEDEIRNHGIYRSTFGSAKMPSRSAQSRPRKRERGVTSGIGSFSNGTLHLSKRDLAESKRRGLL